MTDKRNGKRIGWIAAVTIALMVGMAGISFAAWGGHGGHGGHGGGHRGGYSHNNGCW